MKNLKTYLILFGGVFALSTSAIWVRLAGAPSGVTAFYRLGITAAVLLPFFLLSKSCRAEVKALRRSQWLEIAAAGAFLALHYLLWFESLNYTSIASSTVIVSLQPLFSIVLERVLLKSRFRPAALVGCGIALLGSVIIGFEDFQISGLSLLGDILAFVAAGVIAGYYFLGQTIRKEVSALTYSVLAYLASAVVLLAYTLVRGEPLTGYSGESWLAFVGIALIATVGGQFVFNLLLKLLPASAVTMSILGEPIGTCILAYLFLHESISGQQLLGIVTIIGGLSVYFLVPNLKEKPVE